MTTQTYLSDIERFNIQHWNIQEIDNALNLVESYLENHDYESIIFQPEQVISVLRMVGEKVLILKDELDQYHQHLENGGAK